MDASGVVVNCTWPVPPYPAAMPRNFNCRATHTVTTYRRVCGLCGRPFAILIPPGTEDPERDNLCSECLKLPRPPAEPNDDRS
jgi:hypothetical protein